MDLLQVFLPDGSLLATSSLLTVVSLMFLYTFVGIVAGFGGALTTMPFITMLIPVKMAAPISVTVGTATALYAVVMDRKAVDWKSAITLIISSFVGVPFGLYVLKYAPDYYMKGGLGAFLVIYALYGLLAPKLPKFDRAWLPYPMGFLAGGLGAAFSTNGPPVVIYGVLRDLAPSAFRGTLNAFFAANNVAIVFGMVTGGIMTTNVLKIVILAVPVMVVGWLVGNFIHKRIPKERFQKLVYALLVLSGIMLLKGALGL
ncbi:putative membrane transporter protein [Rhodovastum atsumiense]|uniref:Probable membrane transporter protein n=1 Tax=Rhodovastum atsumiense TaxID=504468 RepID=A0A5M6IMB1_9PROT|nr:sulfite exporter TauE/SafE family protein [Rhodovastum atsumiense]KAA5609087.1 sulfite exporter TauE/SafE family protein [Rhodovastum atsumiense]CAH2602159.1 putative membrane transporter protein [Rhodovastum atsumiense]